jgi:hypothetical protein
MDILKRDFHREQCGHECITKSVAEPALSLVHTLCSSFNPKQSLVEQFKMHYSSSSCDPNTTETSQTDVETDDHPFIKQPLPKTAGRNWKPETMKWFRARKINLTTPEEFYGQKLPSYVQFVDKKHEAFLTATRTDHVTTPSTIELMDQLKLLHLSIPSGMVPTSSNQVDSVVKLVFDILGYPIASKRFVRSQPIVPLMMGGETRADPDLALVDSDTPMMILSVVENKPWDSDQQSGHRQSLLGNYEAQLFAEAIAASQQDSISTVKKDKIVSPPVNLVNLLFLVMCSNMSCFLEIDYAWDYLCRKFP